MRAPQRRLEILQLLVDNVFDINEGDNPLEEEAGVVVRLQLVAGAANVSSLGKHRECVPWFDDANSVGVLDAGRLRVRNRASVRVSVTEDDVQRRCHTNSPQRGNAASSLKPRVLIVRVGIRGMKKARAIAVGMRSHHTMHHRGDHDLHNGGRVVCRRSSTEAQIQCMAPRHVDLGRQEECGFTRPNSLLANGSNDRQKMRDRGGEVRRKASTASTRIGPVPTWGRLCNRLPRDRDSRAGGGG